MKLKKYSYLLVFILMLLIGVNNVYAEQNKTCYYVSDTGDFKASVKFKWGFGCAGCHFLETYSKVYIDKRGTTYDHNEEMIINWISNAWSNTPKNSNVKFDDFFSSSKKANKNEPSCPSYLVFQECGTFRIWATNDEGKAKKAANDISGASKCTGYYASNNTESGGTYTSEEYYSEFAYEGLVKLDEMGLPTCTDFDDMLGDPNNPDSLRYMLDTILQYVRIIVPILIILLGTLDFAKAVIAGKEDNMKKAQIDFVKRLLIGVAVFFVPLLVDVVMGLAELIWQGEYLICDF